MNAVLEHCSDDQCFLLSKFLKVGRHIKALNPDSFFSSFSFVASSRHSDMARRSDPSPPKGPIRRSAAAVAGGGDAGAGADAPWHSSSLSTGPNFPLLHRAPFARPSLRRPRVPGAGRGGGERSGQGRVGGRATSSRRSGRPRAHGLTRLHTPAVAV
jgi:hypothetical protein